MTAPDDTTAPAVARGALVSVAITGWPFGMLCVRVERRFRVERDSSWQRVAEVERQRAYDERRRPS